MYQKTENEDEECTGKDQFYIQHLKEYEDYCRLRCDAVNFGRKVNRVDSYTLNMEEVSLFYSRICGSTQDYRRK